MKIDGIDLSDLSKFPTTITMGELKKLREKAEKWDRVKEIAASDYCSRCFNRFKCPSDDYAPCPFKDILEEVEGEKG